MKAPQFTKALSVKPSKATRDRVELRLMVRAIKLSPKRRPMIDEQQNNLTRSLSKALVWSILQ